ncbi:MAG: hypothetical protein IJA91_07110 [Clostridia bacterium]|nr:hypothetical protein [Clostridia bacterium]
MTDPHARRYFAASNSCRGFCNYYGDLFTDARTDRLYIIKGGPGTGKSHFMKEVARYARVRGYDVTEYACSSDPHSLDGILLEREGTPTVGFLDGTPPHVREPILPGAREDIIHLGAFWDGKRLSGQSDTIRSLSEKKSAAYGRAYAYLAACGEVDRVADSLMMGCVREDKLCALAGRILREQSHGESFSAVPALRRAVSMAGNCSLHTFERESFSAGGTLLQLSDYYGIGYRLTAALLALSKEKKLSVQVSYDPVYPHKIDGLYYPHTGLCILFGHAEPCEGAISRMVSLRRYVHPDALRAVRGELRHAGTLRDRLTESALRELAVAAKYHFELEKIYAAAMDFTAKEAFTESFCRDVFHES